METTTWITVAEALERRLAPSPNTEALLSRIRRHNRRFPQGTNRRIRTQRGYVVLEDLQKAEWNRK